MFVFSNYHATDYIQYMNMLTSHGDYKMLLQCFAEDHLIFFWLITKNSTYELLATMTFGVTVST